MNDCSVMGFLYSQFISHHIMIDIDAKTCLNNFSAEEIYEERSSNSIEGNLSFVSNGIHGLQEWDECNKSSGNSSEGKTWRKECSKLVEVVSKAEYSNENLNFPLFSILWKTLIVKFKFPSWQSFGHEGFWTCWRPSQLRKLILLSPVRHLTWRK